MEQDFDGSDPKECKSSMVNPLMKVISSMTPSVVASPCSRETLTTFRLAKMFRAMRVIVMPSRSNKAMPKRRRLESVGHRSNE